MVRKLQRFAILGGVLLFVACTAAPIMNVQNAPVNVSKSNATLEDVSKAITRAGVALVSRTSAAVLPIPRPQSNNVAAVLSRRGLMRLPQSFCGAQYYSGSIL